MLRLTPSHRNSPSKNSPKLELTQRSTILVKPIAMSHHAAGLLNVIVKPHKGSSRRQP